MALHIQIQQLRSVAREATSASQTIIIHFPSLSSQDRIRVEDGALSVSALTLADAGMYQCVAENKHGVIYFAAELMVLGKGGILSVP